jgi:phytoene dehydrogenase-like protein
MAEKSIIIIGAGLAGLSAGCYAQMNGYRSHIFECHSKPGGVAAWWERQGYLIDGGIHFLMGAKQGQSTYNMYRELGTAQADSLVGMTTYGRFIDENSGRRLDVTKDLARLAREMKAFSPRDAGIINELVSGARAMQGYDMGGMGLGKPQELMSVGDRLKTAWEMRRAFKYLAGKYARPISDYVKSIHDPWLRQFIENLFLPEVPIWFVFMLLGLVADRQMALLKDGCMDFVLPIEKRFKELGGQVTYKATVREILVENDCAVGVRLADGSKHYADVIVSAADGYSTIFNMLGGRYVSKEIENRYKNWKLIRPTVMVSFGVAREFKEQPYLSVIALKDSITIGSRAIPGFSLRIFNYGTNFAPPGKTVVQVMFETEWDYWNELQRDRSRYEAEKKRVADEVLKRLEPHYPGISSQVEMTDVATPYTTLRYTMNYKGAYMGWLPTAEAIMARFERTLLGLANFYMAGQWVVPGGGVPPSLYSGRQVIQLLCHQDKKPFVTTTE